jgi:hypothetical protein
MGTEVKPSGGNSSSLSQADQQSILAQGEKFAQETRERQAEAIRQESERMQQRIAEAERTYKAQAERQRLEQEKNARELAQKEEQTRREEAEREKQREQIAAAEQARLEQEREKAAKLEREKAEREQAQAERAVAAERARLEEERRAAQVAEEKRQREQAEREAQKTPASELITKSDLETIMGFTFQEPKSCEVKDLLSKEPLKDVEEVSSCFFESALPEANRFNKGIKLTVRYLREKDADQAETYIRQAIKRATDSRARSLEALGYGGFYVSVAQSIFVLKPTLRGCMLLQVAMDGAPSEASDKNHSLWLDDLLDREKKIAVKVLGPPKVRVVNYEARHADERTPDAGLILNQPGVDPGIAKIFRPMLQRAAEADAAHIAHSKSVVAASGGAKMLCPKCGGSKKMVLHTYNSGWNPYARSSLPGALYENNRNSTSIVNCDECGGTGVVNER